jgi:hypothetical protein
MVTGGRARNATNMPRRYRDSEAVTLGVRGIGSGLGVQGFGFGVWSLGFRVQGLWFRV